MRNYKVTIKLENGEVIEVSQNRAEKTASDVVRELAYQRAYDGILCIEKYAIDSKYIMYIKVELE